MAEAETEKNKQLQVLEQNNKEELLRISADAAEQIDLIQAMHDEALERSKSQIRTLEKEQENYLKIIEKKNYESTYPKPLILENHQEANPKAFYIQILGCRGAGKSTFLNRFFYLTGLRIIFKSYNDLRSRGFLTLHFFEFSKNY